MDSLKRLLNTTAVRLSLKYSLTYILIFGAAFLVLYWFITRFVNDQIKVNLKREAAKIRIIQRSNGLSAVERYIKSHEQFKGEDHKYYLLINKNGKVLIGDLKQWPSGFKVGKPIENIWVSEKNIIGKVEDGDGYWPMLGIKFKDGSKLLIAQGIRGTEDLRETLFTIMAIIFSLIVIMTLTIGIFLGKSILSHTDNIKNACNSIINGDISKRIPIGQRNDEFDTISMYINSMLDELESFITQSKETANGIAHDLKTPLSRVRNKLEMLLLHNDEEFSNSLEAMLNDIDKIIKMLNSLLSISQIETGALRKNWHKINISKVIDEIVDFYQPFAEEKKIKITTVKESDVFISGNEQLLSQSMSNIIDNAIKYTPEGGKIDISINKKNGFTSIWVCDNGCGVNSKDYDTIVKKFVRLDESRNQSGNGLGLSLVKATADLHKAKLIFKDNNPGLCVALEFKSDYIQA